MENKKFVLTGSVINNSFCAFSICYFIHISFIGGPLSYFLSIFVAPFLLIAIFHQLQKRVKIFSVQDTDFPIVMAVILIILTIVLISGILFKIFDNYYAPWVAIFEGKGLLGKGSNLGYHYILNPNISIFSIFAFLSAWIFVSLKPNSKIKTQLSYFGVLIYIIVWILIKYAQTIPKIPFEG